MKIAQVTPVYPPYRGGMGAVAHEYTERLRALGHTVDVFQPAIKIGNAGFLRSLRRLNQYDVVHVHYPFYGGAEQVMLACRKPIVVTYHMDAIAGGLKGFCFNTHRRLIQPLILRRAKAIFVSSLDYAKHSSLKNYRRQERIHELPFGVDVTRFHPVATVDELILRADLDIPKDAPVLIFVGGLDSAHAFKGLEVLLAAFKELEGASHLIVVGDGDLRADFEIMAADNPSVHFVGAIPPEDLPVYYRAADIHLFPSTSQAEAFGLVALEAAASGIPTIASNLPGVRTVVKDNETGLLVPPSDADALKIAIERLLNDSELREKLGAEARKRVVKEYAWEVLIEKLLDIYRGL